MAAIAHGWKPPAASGIKVPMKVAHEFNAADEQHPAFHREMGKKK